MRRILFVMGAALLLMSWNAEAPQAREAEYTGVKSCARCHRKDDEGAQYKIWQDSEHAEAYEVLGTVEAKKDAKELGVSGDPQEAAACLVCHTTGFGEPEERFSRRFDIEDGVQCEACHGAGSLYDSKRVKKAIWEETNGGELNESATAEKVGLKFPTEETCKRCHSEQITVNGNTYKNPNYEPFDYEEYFDKIKHPVPAEKKP